MSEHPNGEQHRYTLTSNNILDVTFKVLSASLTVFPSVQRRETCPRMNRGFGFHSVDCSGLIIV